MISSLILKNKLCGLLSKQVFARFPLNFCQKLSFFLRNLSRFDYNQPRSRLSMHRFKKIKKRRHGRLKWNLKKYWKFRGIGLKLDVIKEEGAKEYLAEIENDDDSLEWVQCAQPNHILLQKTSATYFGLVKFPANFSPSELALQRLCHGRTLQQTFPSETELQPKTIPTTTSASTNFRTNNKETSKTTTFPTEKANITSSSNSKRVDSQTYHKSPRIKKKASSKSSIHEANDDVLGRQSRTRKIGRGLRFRKKIGKKRRSQIKRMRNKFIEDLTKKIEPNSVPDQEKSSVDSSIHEIVPILITDFEDASSKTEESSCNKTESTFCSKMQFPHAFIDQNSISEDPSSSHQSSSIKFDFKKSDLNMPKVESDQSNIRRGHFEDTDKSGFFENSFKMIGRSIDNILGVWKLNFSKDFAEIELHKKPQPDGIVDLEETLQTNPQNSLEIDKTDENNLNGEDLKTLQLENYVLDVDECLDLKNDGKNGCIMGCNDQSVGEENGLIKNQKSEPPPPRPPTQSPLHPLRSSIETGSKTKSVDNFSSGSTEDGPGALVNYSVDMSSAVRRMFGCCSSDVEGQVGQVARRFVSGGGLRRWGNQGRGMVQLDHKSLWTEFVSDMIVNRRVRNVRMSDG